MKMLIAVLMLLPVAAKAQTAANPSINLAPAPGAGTAASPAAQPQGAQVFTEWLASQRAYLGIGQVVKGDKANYEVSFWSLAQFGQSGINVAKPGANDYVDLGPAQATANDRKPRYGIAVPLHVGNMWNDAHLTAKIDSHINKTKLPPIVVSYIFLLPYDKDSGHNLPLNKMLPWTRDGMVTVTYSFGGPQQAQ